MDIQYLLFLQNIRNTVGDVFNSFCIFITTVAVDYYILVPALILFWTVDKNRCLFKGYILCVPSMDPGQPRTAGGGSPVGGHRIFVSKRTQLQRRRILEQRCTVL